MRGDRRLDAGPHRRALHGAEDGAFGEPAAALTAGKHGIVRAGVAAHGQKRAANRLGQENLAHDAALAQDGELHLTLVP
jgi:hypothetical protein